MTKHLSIDNTNILDTSAEVLDIMIDIIVPLLSPGAINSTAVPFVPATLRYDVIAMFS